MLLWNNMKKYLLFPLLFCIFLFTMNLKSETKNKDSKTINDYVVEVVKSYPTDGTHKYSWPKKGADGKDPYDGVTQDIYYDANYSHGIGQDIATIMELRLLSKITSYGADYSTYSPNK